MPRKKIRNENDAANLLADSALLAFKGEMKSQDLHAITSALSAYHNIRVKQRLEAENSALLAELDEKLSGSVGAKIHLRKIMGRSGK